MDSILPNREHTGRRPSRQNEGATTVLTESASTQVDVRAQSAFESSLRESLFLRTSNARLISLQAYQLVLNGVLIAITILAVSALLTRPVKNQYFLLNEQGRVITEIQPHSDPMLSSIKVRAFADDCVRQILNLDFVHYKTQLANAEACFTRKGFTQLVSLMQERGMLAELSRGYNVGSVLPKQANFLKSSGQIRGQKKWLVKGSYVWSLRQGKKTIQYPLNIEMMLVQVGVNQSVHGMAIETMTITKA